MQHRGDFAHRGACWPAALPAPSPFAFAHCERVRWAPLPARLPPSPTLTGHQLRPSWWSGLARKQQAGVNRKRTLRMRGSPSGHGETWPTPHYKKWARDENGMVHLAASRCDTQSPVEGQYARAWCRARATLPPCRRHLSPRRFHPYLVLHPEKVAFSGADYSVRWKIFATYL